MSFLVDSDLSYIGGKGPQVARLLLDRMAGGNLEDLTPRALLDLETRVGEFASDMREIVCEARVQLSAALQAAERRAERRAVRRGRR